MEIPPPRTGILVLGGQDPPPRTCVLVLGGQDPPLGLVFWCWGVRSPPLGLVFWVKIMGLFFVKISPNVNELTNVSFGFQCTSAT